MSFAETHAVATREQSGRLVPAEVGTSTSSHGEVLVRVENVRKKFCRDLKRSLWYGVQDVASELNPLSGRGAKKPSDSPRISDQAQLRRDEFWAIDDVSFELRRGECMGLIGRNGAGKTTLLKMLNGLIKPDSGRLDLNGKVGALIALGAGFNPLLTGRENLFISGAIYGLTKQEIQNKFDEIVEFAELGSFIDSPVRTYSSGMQVRLGFSIAAKLLQPDILLLDEVLAVGDAAFRAKCELAVGKIMRRAAVILVSHNSLHIRRLCNRVVWLERGRPRGIGPTSKYLGEYDSSCDSDTGQETRCILSENISRAEMKCLTTPQRYNDPLEISIDLYAESQVAIQHIQIGIHEKGGGQVAQSEINSELVCTPLTTLRICSDGPSLRDGDYTVNVAIYGAGRTEMLARFITATQFRLTSNLMSPTAYNFLSTVEQHPRHEDEAPTEPRA